MITPGTAITPFHQQRAIYEATAAAASAANASNTFLRLPQEIRNAIFDHVFGLPSSWDSGIIVHEGNSLSRGHRQRVRTTPQLRAILPLLFTCKALYASLADTLAHHRRTTFSYFQPINDENLLRFKAFFFTTDRRRLPQRITPQLRVFTTVKNMAEVAAVLNLLAVGVLSKLELAVNYVENCSTDAGQLDRLSERFVRVGDMVLSSLRIVPSHDLWTMVYRPTAALNIEEWEAWVQTGVVLSPTNDPDRAKREFGALGPRPSVNHGTPAVSKLKWEMVRWDEDKPAGPDVMEWVRIVAEEDAGPSGGPRREG